MDPAAEMDPNKLKADQINQILTNKINPRADIEVIKHMVTIG